MGLFSHFRKKGAPMLPPVGNADFGLLNLPRVTPKATYRFCGENETLARLWNIALDDIEKSFNTVTEFGTVYSAGEYGKGFSSLVFCRDNAYAGLLSLNRLYPREMREALRAIRQVRNRLGWKCFKSCGCLLRGIDGVENIKLDHPTFFKTYQKASAINKTDDVCWLWAAYDLLVKHPERFGAADWQWLYENGKESFERFYQPFYDPTDGLYFGQPTFIDVGGSGYPKGFNHPKEKERNRCVWVKASSTNALYYKALTVMAEAAERLGLKSERADWQKRAETLRTAMLAKLRNADGSFVYFLHRDGHPEPRRDTLGTAFPVLCGVVTGADARHALAGYPVTQYGTPLIYPYYERNDTYHNNSMWPFADTFYLLAYERAYEVSCNDINRTILCNAYRNGHFLELRDARSNQPTGSWAQLWTTAAFLNVMIRGGLTEFDPAQILIR